MNAPFKPEHECIKKKMLFSHPERQEVYDVIIAHFGNPVCEKIRNQDGYGIYLVEIQSMLLNDKRYLIVMIQNDPRPIHTKDYLSNLKWKSLQTRTMDNEQSLTIPPYTYLVQRGLSANIPLYLESRSKKISIYYPPKNHYPIEVALLHTRDTEYEYPNEGNLASALETFQTIIQFR